MVSPHGSMTKKLRVSHAHTAQLLGTVIQRRMMKIHPEVRHAL